MTTKRLTLFLLLWATAAFAGSMSDGLVGHWRCAKEGFVSEYVIKDDGTFTGELTREGKMLWTNAGTWTLSGKTISIELTKSSVEQVPAGTKDRNTIIELTKENCRLRVQDGSTRNYLRVP